MWGNRVLAIGGTGRSGTSILGNLIASCKHVEYFFEPEHLEYLLHCLPEYPLTQWGTLFRKIAYDDLLKNSIAGRNLNFNPHDDSYVLNYKDSKEIEYKHSRTWTHKDIVEESKKKILVFKVLDSIQNVDLAKRSEPGMEALVIIREPVGTIRSLIKKGWFSDDAIDKNAPDPARPYTWYKGVRVFDFVRESDRDDWCWMNETERCAYYYKRAYEGFEKLTGEKFVRFISYDRFVKDPDGSLEALMHGLGLTPGEKTDLIKRSIRRTERVSQDSKVVSIREDGLDTLKELHDRIAHYSIDRSFC